MNIVPRMIRRGISKEDCHRITVENPKRWLTFE
jgi:predicted metal-dependent phosphotriesterase family hydrolase